jgi:hypothetical protein
VHTHDLPRKPPTAQVVPLRHALRRSRPRPSGQSHTTVRPGFVGVCAVPPGRVEPRFLVQATAFVVLMFFNSNSIGVSMPRLEWRRACASSRRMLVADTRKPSLPSSPPIRRWTQPRFSRASRTTNSRTLSRQRRTTRPASRLSPLPADHRAMPAQQRARSHKKRTPRTPWQVTGRGRKKRPISCPQPRPRDLAAQNLELVAEHEQLDGLHIQTTTATNKRAKQSANSKAEEREDHAADPPNPSPKEAATRLLAPFTGHPVGGTQLSARSTASF